MPQYTMKPIKLPRLPYIQPEPDWVAIGAKARAFRDKHGITREELAPLLNSPNGNQMEPDNLRKLEKGLVAWSAEFQAAYYAKTKQLAEEKGK